MSPDFRQRASSNASSVGRLSPIPSLALENDWNNYANEFIDDDDEALGDNTPNSILEDLAGTLADELTLQSDLFNQGSVLIVIKQMPPSLHSYSLTNQVVITYRGLKLASPYLTRVNFSPRTPNSA